MKNTGPLASLERNEVRVLLVAARIIIRLGLRAALASTEGIVICGEAGTLADATREIMTSRPDAAIAGLHLPDGTGIDACRALHAQHASLRILVLVEAAAPGDLIGYLAAGAAGIVRETDNPESIADAIRRAARGEPVIPPTVMSAVLEWMQQGILPTQALPVDLLSNQKRKMLPLLAAGLSNHEIAASLYLSPNTVRAYTSEIYHALGLKRRAEVSAYLARIYDGR
ncbi:MAG: two-component system, NarL family, response regulator DevR [Chloroflexota bacterium]|nr:two-component system, NarL family, response regulator DevR [Chloroflexota bacterium]